MTKFFILGLTAATVLFASCASQRNNVVLDTVGPVQPSKPDAISTTEGTLVVYSAFDQSPHFNASDPYRPVYSNYRIFSLDGTLLKKIRNNDGTILQRPVGVGLPPGKYSVTAPANGYGFVTIPVIIKGGQSTVVHLEGGAKFGSHPTDDTNYVRLPDGQIVGWRASL